MHEKICCLGLTTAAGNSTASTVYLPWMHPAIRVECNTSLKLLFFSVDSWIVPCYHGQGTGLRRTRRRLLKRSAFLLSPLCLCPSERALLLSPLPLALLLLLALRVYQGCQSATNMFRLLRLPPSVEVSRGLAAEHSRQRGALPVRAAHPQTEGTRGRRRKTFQATTKAAAAASDNGRPGKQRA